MRTEGLLRLCRSLLTALLIAAPVLAQEKRSPVDSVADSVPPG